MENCKWLLAQDLLCIKGFLLGRVAERENTLSQTAPFGREVQRASCQHQPLYPLWRPGPVPGLHPSLDGT